MRNYTIFYTAALLFVIASPAMALDLAAARAAGSVCEQADGFIAAKSASPDVNQLVSDVNAKRRTEYAKISSQKGQTVAVVGQLAAQQIASQPGVAPCK